MVEPVPLVAGGFRVAGCGFRLPRAFLVALGTPLLWWLAGLPWGAFPLGWIALAPLFIALRDLPRRARWRLGYAIGWLSFALLNWWIVPTIARGGPVIGLPVAAGALLGVLAVALIALIHGLGVALIALLWDTRHPLAQRRPWLLPLAVALAWFLFDWTRSLGPLAHMWGALAYTQWRDTAFLQSAASLGQHGLSALCAWFAACFALWWTQPSRLQRAMLWFPPVLVFTVLHFLGALRLRRPVPAAPRLPVLLVQTAVPALQKNRGAGEAPLQQAIRLTTEYFAKAPDAKIGLIVWPESTFNFRRFGAQKMPTGLEWAEAAALSRRLQTPILAGGLSQSVGPDGEELFNEAALILPDGKSYSSPKMRLVPFGERAVGGELLPFLNRLAPEPPLSRANAVRTLPLPQEASTLPIGSVICFESCFPTPARQLRKEGARALFVLTNDAWFDGTEAPWQHATMAAMRAVENGVPVVQAANGGYAVAFDAHGRLIARGAYNQPQTLRVELNLGYR